MAKTRGTQDASSRAKKNSQSKKSDLYDSPQLCPVCLDTIIDAKDGQEGQDSVCCEGVCNGWIHRRCAGLSLAAFAVISSSSNSQPFYCPNCRLDRQSQEIADLKATIQQISESVQRLQPNQTAKLKLPVVPQAIQVGASYAAVAATPVSISPPTTTHVVQRLRPDRRFNLVIYGIKESPKGTQRHIRSAHVIEAATSILSSVDSSITELSIRDCYRLGKYSEERCRPVLATMNRSSEVTSVLANRRQLSHFPDISIKPDLPPEVRKVESILLKQRRDLISSGTEARSIKLRKDTLFVNGRKHGVVINSQFQLCSGHLSAPSSNVTPADQSTALSSSSTSAHQANPQINTSSDSSSTQVVISGSQSQ